MRKPNCIDCPLQNAYSEYVLQSNLNEGSVDLREIALDLSSRDYRILISMTEEDQAPYVFKPVLRVVPLESECKGPRRRFLIGKLSCTAGLDFVPENRNTP